MGILTKLFKGSHTSECPECGEQMEYIKTKTPYMFCSSCGYQMFEDGTTSYCDEKYEDIWDDIPPGCSACGGDYPNCIDGCPMFDD